MGLSTDMARNKRKNKERLQENSDTGVGNKTLNAWIHVEDHIHCCCYSIK